MVNPQGEEPGARGGPKVKSFEIGKRLIVEAREKVRADNGAPGVDAVSAGLFEEQLKGSLYKLRDRMSSGCCFPGPVRGVEIPRDHGEGVRLPGVPGTAGRVAQTAAAMLLGRELEPVFHRGSYGYRPGRSAVDALAACRRRRWAQDWVLDLDVRAFFGSVPHSLLLKAAAHHTGGRWVLLCISRWLKAPVQMPDGPPASQRLDQLPPRLRRQPVPRALTTSPAGNPQAGHRFSGNWTVWLRRRLGCYRRRLDVRDLAQIPGGRLGAGLPKVLRAVVLRRYEGTHRTPRSSCSPAIRRPAGPGQSLGHRSPAQARSQEHSSASLAPNPTSL